MPPRLGPGHLSRNSTGCIGGPATKRAPSEMERALRRDGRLRHAHRQASQFAGLYRVADGLARDHGLKTHRARFHQGDQSIGGS
jgi:hypothetical protein